MPDMVKLAMLAQTAVDHSDVALITAIATIAAASIAAFAAVGGWILNRKQLPKMDQNRDDIARRIDGNSTRIDHLSSRVELHAIKNDRAHVENERAHQGIVDELRHHVEWEEKQKYPEIIEKITHPSTNE